LLPVNYSPLSLNRPVLKKFSFLILLAVCSLFFSTELSAQKTEVTKKKFTRCGTMQRVAQLLQYNTQLKSQPNLRSNSVSEIPRRSSQRLMATVTVPVVVHIVLPNPFFSNRCGCAGTDRSFES